MVSRVKILVANARGVAERWRSQYQTKEGNWTRTIGGDSENIYNKLCDLGHSPDIAKVAEVIGNKSWSYLTCSGCGEDQERIVSFGSDYSDSNIQLCALCLKDGVAALNQ